ncbi:MAG: caspase family protein [Brasilonema angustatum HA4187-MV1]|jgi:WD40 repeat protein|nr:caspase family protein [Brasilonema angustatum HA4187-MV1]
MPDFARNMAFVIGINNYSNGIPPLRNALNDAKKLVEILREQHGYQVWVCLDQVATLKNLQDLFEKTLAQQVKPDDRLLFYFAGHGIALNSEDGPSGYLIPQDAKLGDTKTYLPMTQVHESLSNLPCRHFLGILDCCFAGAFRWSSTRDLLMASEVIHQERYDRFITDPAWQVITSAASDQKALDAFTFNIDRGEIGNHSPFASALLEALTGRADAFPPATNDKPCGDGVITATELYLYLRDHVELATQENRLRQTPGISALNKHDKGEYIFLTPGHVLNLPPAPPLDESKNPYRGLLSFDEKHSDLFFGRTALVDKLHKFVTTNPLTVVLGASGSGKSSLVKAGLIPQLRKSTMEHMEQWYILSTIRPGEFPLRALNIALKNAKLPEVEVSNPSFGQAVKNLAESIKVWATSNPNFKLLLCIDQSEELITLCRDEKERQEFFRQLGEAIATYPQQLRVVITLRSDFEPQLRDFILQLLPNALQLENTAIKNKWKVARFIVPAMSRTELREAIEKPAEARVMYFYPHSLVDQLIDEVADMPGALPLLSFALREMYLKYLKRQREASNSGITIDRAFTQADYEELGGVIQSLTQRADQEYKALVKVNPAYEQTVRHVVLRMVALGGGEIARRQVPRSELEYPEALQPQIEEVIKRFSDARLLISGTDAEDKSYVEPAHDALVRGWQRLQNWIKQEKNLRLQRRLTPAAVEWKSKQQKDYLWHSDPYLDVLQKEVLNSSKNNWLNQVETEFVKRSIQRLENNYRIRMGLIAAALITVSGFGIIEWYQRQVAELQALASSSEALFASGRQLDGLRDGLKAGQKLKSPIGAIVPAEAKSHVKTALMQAVSLVNERNILQEPNDKQNQVRSVRFSPDGSILASAGDDNTIRLWNVASGKEWHKFTGHKMRVNSVDFSFDGKLLASASWDGKIKLWNLANFKEVTPRSLIGHKEPVYSVSFNQNGTILASASWDGTIKLWRVSNGDLIQTLTPQNQKNKDKQKNPVNVVNFSEDDKLIVASTEDGTIYLWDWDDKKQDAKLRKTWQGHEDQVIGVMFSPRGKILASASFDNTVKLWSIPDGKLIKTLTGHQNQVYSVSFSCDGKTLASAGSDNTVKLWSLDNPEKPKEIKEITTLVGHKNAIFSVRFSRDGKSLASAGADSNIRLWNLENDVVVKKLPVHKDSVNSVSFSPVDNGNEYTFVSSDKTIRFWSLKNDEITMLPDNSQINNSKNSSRKNNIAAPEKSEKSQKNQIRDHRKTEENPEEINSVSLNAKNKMLASGSIDGTIKLRDLATHKLKQTLPQDSKENLRTLYNVNFNLKGDILAATYESSIIKLWHISGNDYKDIKPIHSDIKGYTLDFSPNSDVVATTNDNGIIKLWKMANGQEIQQLKGNESKSLNFSPDGKILASADADHTIKLWDMTNYKLINTLKGHTEAVRDVRFSPDGQILASASEDNTIKLWNRDGKELITLKGHTAPVYSVSFSHDGKYLISGGADKTVRLWNLKFLDLEPLVDRGCRWVRDYLQNNPNVSESDRHLCDN